MTELKSISDDELLHRLSEILKQSRRVEADLVAHIAEVDARRLYAREAAPSMFAYCREVLHLSEAEAYLRIAAARAARKHPVLLAMLRNGRLHLSGIGLLAPHLDGLSAPELERVLERATHTSKREIEVLVAELAPKPDVPAAMRKLPVQKAKVLPTPSAPPANTEQLRPERVAPAPSAPPPRPIVEPLAPARYKVQFTADAELHDKLERLIALTPDGDLAAVIDAAVTEKLERVEAKRFGKTDKPRRTVEDADTSPGSRNIPAPVKRIVCARDGNQCTYVSPEGRRCSARERLEFHHDDPYARGGDRTPNNIRLMCREHNAYLAELDYGKGNMDRYRKAADCVREPSPSLVVHGRTPIDSFQTEFAYKYDPSHGATGPSSSLAEARRPGRSGWRGAPAASLRSR